MFVCICVCIYICKCMYVCIYICIYKTIHKQTFFHYDLSEGIEYPCLYSRTLLFIKPLKDIKGGRGGGKGGREGNGAGGGKEGKEGEGKKGEKGKEEKKSFYQYILLCNLSSRNKKTEKGLHCDSPWWAHFHKSSLVMFHKIHFQLWLFHFQISKQLHLDFKKDRFQSFKMCMYVFIYTYTCTHLFIHFSLLKISHAYYSICHTLRNFACFESADIQNEGQH